jgi:non-ribosomal peptide synthetase component F
VALELQALGQAQSRAYWHSQLEGCAATLLAGTGSHRKEGGPTLRIERELALPAAVQTQLERLANQLGVPVKAVLLAAHLKVLGLVLGQCDVVCGLTLNGRPESEDGARVLGLFINTVPLRMQLGAESWRELVQRSFAAERAALAHRRFPLSEIVKDCGAALPFDTVFNFTRFHVAQGLYSGEQAVIRDRRGFAATHFTCTAEFMVRPGESRLRGLLIFDGASVHERRRELIATLYERALAAMAVAPDDPHSALVLEPATAVAGAVPAALLRRRRTATRPALSTSNTAEFTP